jgi:Undecaprenyl-phosphate glucose phosphotransferase
MLVLAFGLAAVGRVEPLDPGLLLAAGASGVALVGLLRAVGLYRIGFIRDGALRPVLVVWWAVSLTGVLTWYAFAAGPAPFAAVGWSFVLGGSLGVILCRLGATVILRRLARRGRLEQLTVVVGGGERAERLIEALDRAEDAGLRICGVFDDRWDDRSPELVARYPKLGTVDDLVEHVRRVHVDLVVIALPLMAERRIHELTRKLSVLPVDVRITAQDSGIVLSSRSFSYVGGVPLLRLLDKPLADWNAFAKALFDRLVGAILLLLASPVMLAVAIAVKLDSPGPVLFRQKRYGFNNEAIDVFKFRSMRTDMTDASGWKVVTKGDPRVTRVGRFIRKTSLDELPQLFNVVFKGNLSLVGPRPHPLQARAVDRLFEQAVDGYFARHRVKPGVTGWAQVNGWRGEVDSFEKIQNRVKFDLEYIENWSVLFDLYILLRTPLALANTEHAY